MSSTSCCRCVQLPQLAASLLHDVLQCIRPLQPVQPWPLLDVQRAARLLLMPNIAQHTVPECTTCLCVFFAAAGVGAAFISPDSPPTSSSSSNTIRLLKLGKGTIQPTVPPGISSVAAASSLAAGWAELSSAALHGPSGRVFTAVPYAAKRQQLATCVGSWVSSWVL